MHSVSPWTDSAPVDTVGSLSAATDPIPSTYLASTDDTTTMDVNVIEPNSGIVNTSSEETVQAIDASELTVQPIVALTAGSDFSSGSLLEANDPNFSQQFLNFSAVPTGGTAQEQPEADPYN